MCGSIVLTFLALGLCLGSSQSTSLRITGGSTTTIDSYPYVVSLLRSSDLVNYIQSCAGVILTSRSVLTAARCVFGDQPNRLRIRAGSTSANRNGTVYNVAQIIVHPNYNARTYDSDVAILKTSSSIVLTNTVKMATIPSTVFIVPDNQTVTAVGWGATSYGGAKSELLRHVQVWTINQQTCVNRYAALRYPVTDNMLCSGWLGVGGRDQCEDDYGGPLVYNSVVVGIYSWGYQCGLASYPGVNTRISKFTPWIQANA